MADELIYSRGSSDEWRDFPVAHRVVKRTKTRIYVDQEFYSEASRADWDQHPEWRHCFTLDRATFEREGRAVGKRRGLLETFYVTKELALRRPQPS